jgi:hypothetical protein
LSPHLKKSAEDKEFRSDYDRALGFVDYLLQQKRPEDASRLFDDITTAIKTVRKRNRKFISLMVECARDALRRGLKKQAADIVLELTYTKPREAAYSVYVELEEDFLKSLPEVPDRDMVAIPLFHGLIDEDMNRLSDAEKVYMQAVIYSLNKVNTSYGDHIPATLNEFYLLGRLWQNDDKINILASLDRVYTLLEKKVLEEIKEKERQRVLGAPLDQLADLQKQRERQRATIEEEDRKMAERKKELEQQQQEMIAGARAELAQESRELSLLTARVVTKTLATLVIQIVLLGLLIGCAVLAWRYSQRMREQKTYAFVTRYVELNGWLRVFSLLDILTGFGLILVGQFFQLFQKINEAISPDKPGTGPARHLTEQKPETAAKGDKSEA